MVSAWRHLFHGVIPVAVDGLPLAVLAPEDQGRSDHQLCRLRAALELPPPTLDEDPIRHVAAHRQEGGLARDLAPTRHELRSHPLPALADFGPAALDPSPEPALAYLIGVRAQRLHGVGVPVGYGAERPAEPIQERPQGIHGIRSLLHYEVLLSSCSPPERLCENHPRDSSTTFSIVKLYRSVVTLHPVTREVKSPAQKTPLRREQAALTRARIIEGATAVFEARGYEGARIEDIASEARVAVPTVYKVFANKRNLLKASVEAAIRGGEAGEVERQAWFREQLEEPTAEGQLRLIARNARRMYDRAGQLLEVVRAAAASDTDIEALWRGINDERLGRARTSASRLASKAKLRTTVGEAARTLWVLSVPELYVLQIHTGGLNPDDYERWLGDLLVAALLGD